jgi:endonuclease III-like uncharacterized protein
MKLIQVTTDSKVGRVFIPKGRHELGEAAAAHILNAGHGRLLASNDKEVEQVISTDVEQAADTYGLSKGIIKALSENGIDVEVALTMTKDELVALDGIGESSADSILDLVDTEEIE